MRLQKRTYSMPVETIERFEHSVAAGRRSAIVSRLVNEWLDVERRARLRAEVIAGCLDMAELDIEIEREFHPLEEEVERVLGSD